MSNGGAGGPSSGQPPIYPHVQTKAFSVRAERQAATASVHLQEFLAQLASRGLNTSLDEKFLAQLQSISQEKNPESFFHSLLTFGSALQNAGKLEPASLIFSSLAQADSQLPIGEALRRKSQERLDAQTGVGKGGARLEFLASRFVADCTSPAMLLGMTGAGILGRLSYSGILSRLVVRPATELFSRGLAAHALAGTGSLLLEAPAFTLMVKGVNQWTGQPSPWTAEALGPELAASLVFLGSMKLSHALGKAASKNLSNPLTRHLLPQATTLGGILSAHHLETALGLKSQMQNETLWVDALAMLVNFQVSGNLSRRLTGRGFNAWVSELEYRASDRTPGSTLGSELLSPAAAGVHSAEPSLLISMMSKKPDEPGGRLSLKPPAEVSIRPSDPESVRQVHSDRAPEISERFEQDIARWAGNIPRAPEDLAHLKALLSRIYEEMWRVLNFESGTRLAHRIASGETITVRIIGENTDLKRYKLQLLDQPKASPTHFNQVHWSFNPASGSLNPLETAAHAIFELQAQQKSIDVSRFFISFYRHLQIQSDALQSSTLVAHLPEATRAMVLQDPTLVKPLPTVEAAKSKQLALSPREPEIHGPTMLVQYRPLIFEGSREQVDQYADVHQLHPDGRRRLQRLIQLMLATLHERESHLDRPENKALAHTPYVHVIVGPTPAGPERRVEILTHRESFLRKLAPDEVMLSLVRYPQGFGELHDYAFLQHEYRQTNPAGDPIGADRKFQERLGLPLVAENGELQSLHLRLDYLHLRQENMEAWNQWMLDNGYWQPPSI